MKVDGFGQKVVDKYNANEIDIDNYSSDLGEYLAAYDDLPKAVHTFFNDNLKGKIVKTQIGDVHILGSSWQKKLKFGIKNDELRAKSIPFIPNILSQGQYNGKKLKEKTRKDGYIAFHAFVKELDIDNQSVFVRLLVGERENNQYEFVVYSLYPNKNTTLDSIKNPTMVAPESAEIMLGSNVIVNNFLDDVNIKNNNMLDSIADDQDGWNIDIVRVEPKQENQNPSLDKLTVTSEMTNKERKKAVSDWLRNNLQGKTITTVDGKKVYFNRNKSVDYLLQDALISKNFMVQAITRVPEVFMTGEFVGRKTLYKERKDKFVAFHAYRKWVVVDGQEIHLQVKAGELDSGLLEAGNGLIAYSAKDLNLLDSIGIKNSTKHIPRWQNAQLSGEVFGATNASPPSVSPHSGLLVNNRVHCIQGDYIMFDDLSQEEEYVFLEILEVRPLNQDESSPPNSNITKGRTSQVKTAKGTKVSTVFALVDSKFIISSHTEAGNQNPDYLEELQPRDRSRDNSIAWVIKTANNLDPESLGRTSRADTGAPIVGDDLMVESGNGRTMAIKLAYKNGTADKYRQWLIDEADTFGFSADQVLSYKEPILVRIRTSNIDRVAFASEANQDDKLSLTATERAKIDAKRLDERLLSLFDPSDDGNVLAASNTAFIREFLAALGDTEAAQYTDKNGKPTTALVERIKAAIFAKAYDDERLLEMMADTANPDLQNILNALSKAAPSFIKARGVCKADAQDLSKSLVDGIEVSVNEHLKNAVIDASNLLLESKQNNQVLTEYIKQQNLFSDTPDEVIELALFLHKNIRSVKKISEFLNAMSNYIYQDSLNRQNENLFGEPEPLDLTEVMQYAAQETGVGLSEETTKEHKTDNTQENHDYTQDDIDFLNDVILGKYDVLADDFADKIEAVATRLYEIHPDLVSQAVDYYADKTDEYAVTTA